MVFCDFKNKIEVIKQRSKIIFRVKDEIIERNGVDILDYLEAAICEDVDYIYYHYGDNPMTKIVMNESDYTEWRRNIVEDGMDLRLL